MKRKKLILFLITSFILMSFQFFKNFDLVNYFINPKLGKTNFRAFKSNNPSLPIVLFKQIIQNNSDNSISIEYYFMTKDSIPFAGGIEKNYGNKVEISEQYLYFDNRKIIDKNIIGKIWEPLAEKKQKISNEFLDKKTGHSFKTYSEPYARIKDTLGEKSFIVEFKSKTLYLKHGEVFHKVNSKSKRLYIKNIGLVYYEEAYDGNIFKYHLIK